MNPTPIKLGTHRGRRVFIVCVMIVAIIGIEAYNQIRSARSPQSVVTSVAGESVSIERARDVLDTLAIKGRAPFTGYSRSKFGSGWASVKGCDMRNRILARDLRDISYGEGNCIVLSGTLQDPYTDTQIYFLRGQSTSDDVQIDHVVALADAWQKGAQSQSEAVRESFANDPLNLLAVDGPTNVAKGSSDAASWLPSHKAYRCAYVARQIAVKKLYELWVTRAEYNAMDRVLRACPDQKLPMKVGVL